jgi:hypothetical protein
MTTVNQLIRRELLNIEAIKQRCVQCMEEGNQKRAQQCREQYKALSNKFDESLGDYHSEYQKMMIEYGLLTITNNNSLIYGDKDTINWNEEFRNYSNSLN